MTFTSVAAFLLLALLPTKLSAWSSSGRKSLSVAPKPLSFSSARGRNENNPVAPHAKQPTAGAAPWPLAATSNDAPDSGEPEPPSFLSANDLERLQQIRQRHATIPIMLLDAILPGQQLNFSLQDKRFRNLAYQLKNHTQEYLGLIGFDPSNGAPLNVGVTVKILSLEITEKLCTICIQGDERFFVESEPYMDPTESYYLADVDLVEYKEEPQLSAAMQREATSLSDEIPYMIQEWLTWLYKTGRATPESMKPRLPFTKNGTQSLPESSSVRERAIWTAALVNPLPALGVCLEIRPSMLICENDLERMRLAHVSLQASIDHLSGKSKLF